MSGDSSTDGFDKTRPVLGDLTNHALKRGFSAILGDSAHKPEDGIRVSQFAKKIHLGVENLHREKKKQRCGSSSPSTETDGSQENTEPGASNVNTELKSSVFVDLDASRDSSFSSVPDEELTRCSQASATQCKLVEGQTRSPLVTVCNDSETGLGFTGMFLKNPGSFEFRRCTNLSSRVDNVGDDVLKACSCSFCLKAAYIWSDLHYQDIKGRLSALKKSQKEANTLAQRNSKDKETDIRVHGNAAKLSKLESDLTNHWKSLFCHMEDVLVNESNQLQANFMALKDLRENCKIDLEMINGKH